MRRLNLGFERYVSWVRFFDVAAVDTGAGSSYALAVLAFPEGGLLLKFLDAVLLLVLITRRIAFFAGRRLHATAGARALFSHTCIPAANGSRGADRAACSALFRAKINRGSCQHHLGAKPVPRLTILAV